MKNNQQLPVVVPILSGIVLCAYICFSYLKNGFVLPLIYGWLAAIVIAGIGFYQLRSRSGGEALLPSKFDWIWVILIPLLASPFYLINLYEIPVQVNTDEPGDCMVSAWFTGPFEKPNLFAFTGWWGLPAFQFIITGWIAKGLGGVTLYHMRLIQASIALSGIAFTYIFARLMSRSRMIAAGAAIFVGFNHAFIGIGRMAMRNVDVVLTITAACSLLWIAIQRMCPFYAYLGGVVIGFANYLYYPGRMSLFIWGAFLFIVCVLFRREYKIKQLAFLFGSTLIGWALVICPHFMSATIQPDLVALARDYSKRTFLLSQEAQQDQMAHFRAPTAWDGIMINVRNGLSVFNNEIEDQSTTYPNYGHGFVDPVSGILLWIGLLVVGAGLRTNRASLFLFLGFLTCWLIPSFLVTMSPHYPRLLAVLPFAGVLVATGTWFLSGPGLSKLTALFKKQLWTWVAPALFACMFVVIAVLNLRAYEDYVSQGVIAGDNLGSAVRYVEDRRSDHDINYYLVGDADYPLFKYGNPGGWRLWVGATLWNHDKMAVLKPGEFRSAELKTPFAMFINDRLWTNTQSEFESRYPGLHVRKMSSDHKLLVIEVPAKPGPGASPGK